MAHNFQKVAGFPIACDPATFSMQLCQMIDVADDCEVFVIDLGDRKLVGFLMAELARSRISGGTFASEVLLWIEPEHRGRWFKPLVAAYERWAMENGADGAFLSSQMDQRTSVVFERIGYKAVQTHHLKVF